MLTCYLSLCAVSLGIAAVFWLHGAGVVLLFAGVELAAVGIALLVHARHALDRETLEIDGDHLRIVREHGGRLERWQFRLAWLRVEPSRGQGSLVELSGDGQRVRVGRYIRAEARQQLAQELRREIRAAAVPAAAAVVRD